jgi:16S rRNA (guanine966-N2)-methyltransferase
MRICGGVHRSRVLATPRGTSTRPTSDRVREALFSMLQSRGAVARARAIDLYAGTGALGLEALSRGAMFVTFVESDRRALEALARNIDALRERDRSRILPYAVERAVTTLTGDGASLVLCDPPYADVASGSVARLLATLVTQRIACADASIVLEHASRDASRVPERIGDGAPGTDRLERTEQRQYGDTTLTFFRVCSAS